MFRFLRSTLSITLLGALLWISGCDALFGAPSPTASEPVRFTVPKGATAGGLADELAQAGLIRHVHLWRLFLKTGVDASCVKAGDHHLRADMDMEQLLATLCSAPLPEDVPFTVVEGWRYRDIDAALAAEGWIEPGAYAAAAEDPARFELAFPFEAETLEGYLFPDTYRVVPRRFQVDRFVQRQLDTFAQRFWKPHAEALGERALEDVVIMASMVEREEPDPAMRAKVAGILWKRLDAKWNLGVDATSRYTLPDWNDRRAFLQKLRDPDDPYNTRLRGGLPPTPIGNPGIDALEAAISPESSPYWYYLHDSERKVHFGRNAAEHQANRVRYDVW